MARNQHKTSTDAVNNKTIAETLPVVSATPEVVGITPEVTLNVSKEDAVELKADPSIVKPMIREGTKKHALEKLFAGDPKNLPILKSVGFGRIEANGNWVSYVIQSRGNKIISIEVSDPDQRAIAEDTAKAAFVTELMDKGF